MRIAKLFATILATLAIATPAFADTLTGLWRGEYICGQGITALSLAMREDSRGRVEATFTFSAHPKNPGVPTGCFTLAGRRSAKSDALTLKPQRWLKQPDPFWYMIDLNGKVSPDGAGYSGVIDTPPAGFCTTFSVKRVSPIAPHVDNCDEAALVS